ncbi:MAG TPA: hypothetical protein VHH55_02065 [Gaiellaceae bacterium]|jgi:hypothetical protein|nr:hypothetical protein [Gaiellaceae bacterium]
MRAILDSPRRRRRLAKAIMIPLLLAAVIVAGILALPEAQEDPPEVFGKQRAVNIAAGERSVRLTRGDRRQVNETIDVLINAGVKREDPGRLYKYATPQLRAQATPAEWRRGDIPVYPYPALGKRFHGWTINYSQPNHLNVDLLVMPGKDRARLGPVALTLDLRKIRNRWLVDGIFPVATFAPLPPQGNRGPVVSTYDLVPAAAGSAPTGARSRLGSAYFAIPAALVGGGILVVAGYFVLRGVRDRRAQRRYLAQRSLQSQ